MTAELRQQHDRLTAASDLIDRRRRFTEAVLSGVSAGVIGVDGKGRVTDRSTPRPRRCSAPAARRWLGKPIADVLPELAPLVEEALRRRASASSRRRSSSPRDGQRAHPQRARHERAGARRGEGLRRHARRHHRSRLGAAHLRLGRRGAAHRARDQEPADADPALGRAHPAQIRQGHHRATARSSTSAPTRSCARSTTSSAWSTSSRPSPACRSRRSADEDIAEHRARRCCS